MRGPISRKFSYFVSGIRGRAATDLALFLVRGDSYENVSLDREMHYKTMIYTPDPLPRHLDRSPWMGLLALHLHRPLPLRHLQ